MTLLPTLSQGEIIAVVGSREFDNPQRARQWVHDFVTAAQPARVISGGARGVDRWAAEAARAAGIAVDEITPDWTQGRGAGMIRNTDIVRASHTVAAFWNGQSRGTQDTITKAWTMGRRLLLFTHYNPVPEIRIPPFCYLAGSLFSSPLPHVVPVAEDETWTHGLAAQLGKTYSVPPLGMCKQAAHDTILCTIKPCWNQPARLEWVEAALTDLVRHAPAAVPKIGCGGGGLQWNQVASLIEKILRVQNFHIYI